MSNVQEQKCPSCGAPMKFVPATGLFMCENCGNRVDIATGTDHAVPEESVVSGIDADEMLAHVVSPDAEDLPVYNCVSCGAEVIAPPEQIALTCPYCGNNIVLTDKVSGKLRPDGVIPFRIESRDLPAAVRRFYKGKKLLPRGFFSDATIGRITGVYVPFWVFSGRMSGTLTYTGTIVTSGRQGDYIITDTAYYRLVRDAALDFKDLPVDAGSKIDDKLMDSLEPFRMEDVKDFDMRYLAGFTADRFDQGKQDISERAQNRMRSSTVSAASRSASVGYGSATPVSQKLKASLQARYLLFPVYMFDVRHKDKSYHFAVNGQTGKVVGELPVDAGVSALYFLTRAGITGGILIAATVAKYLLGY